MISSTGKEGEALLKLFKDAQTPHNAHTLSKLLGVSHVGAQKMLKRLLEEGILTSERIGRAIIYKPNIKEGHIRALVEYLLVDEANRNRRWKEEFKQICLRSAVCILFGSILVNEEKANDIDLIIIPKGKEASGVRLMVESKQRLLPKKIHAIYFTKKDLRKNIKEGNAAVLDAVKNGIVLTGQREFVEMLKNVASS